MVISYSERVRINTSYWTYGNAIELKGIRLLYSLLAVLIPFIIPLWAVVLIPNKIKLRY